MIADTIHSVPKLVEMVNDFFSARAVDDRIMVDLLNFLLESIQNLYVRGGRPNGECMESDCFQ